MAQVRFLEIIVDGELVAEAPMVVHDPEKAWTAFTACFASFAPQVIGELFEAMRMVCQPDTPRNADTGIKLNIKLAEKVGVA